MSSSNLTNFELDRAYRLEKLDSVGEVIHLSSDLVGTDPFRLKKFCSRGCGECIHEFNVYHSQNNGDVYFHRCDHCSCAIRITKEFYWHAREIHSSGGSID